jgi:hypothetical protein
VTKALARLEAMKANPAGNAAGQRDAEFKELAQLQRVLFSWDDRRARQGMPPAAEAVALGDLVQRCQQQLIGDIVSNGEPLPLPPGVDPTAANKAKQQWQNVIDSAKGANWQPRDGNRISVSPAVATPVQGTDPVQTLKPADMKQFQNEVLTDLAMLMQTDAGRKLIDQLNNTSDHALRIKPGKSQGCLPVGTSADQGGDKKEGVGSQAAVFAVLGAKDSDLPMKGKDGNVLLAPTAIILGHEMIHGLHLNRGKNKHSEGPEKIPDKEKAKWLQGGMTEIKEWDNMEEYNTIFRGKLSEQTLRAQFGMSAERYGHREATAGKAVSDSLRGALQNDTDIENLGGRSNVDEAVRGLGFDPDQFTDSQRIGIMKAQLKGPLPQGWPSAQMSVPQIAAVVAKQIAYADFAKLGWSPFDLDDTQLGLYVKHEAYEGRTPQGLAYRAKGNDPAFDAMKTFTKATMVRMPAPPAGEFAGPLSGVCTPPKMATLTEAETVLNDFLKQGQFANDAELFKRASPRVKFSNRLAAVSAAAVRAENVVVMDFSDASVDTAVKVETDEKKLVATMTESMKKIGALLANAKRGVAVSLEEALAQARKDIYACRSAKGGIIASEKSKKNREALCTTFERQCTDLEGLIKTTSERANATLIAILKGTGYTPADVETFNTLVGSPYLTPEIRGRIANQMKDAAEWLRKHPPQ